MLIKTTAQGKIARLRKRIRIVKGGTSASKTFTILPFLIHYAVTNPKAEISVVAETIPNLKRGAIRDFIKIMDMTGNWKADQYNMSDRTYTFNNGSYIEFFSADMPSKLRGARRDILFINECNNVSFESYHQLAIRTRKFIYLDYNPVEEFWVDTELMNDANAECITLTYKDNEALEPSLVHEIEKAKEKAKTSTYWANWWKVYGLGEIGSLQGVVYDNWKQVDTIPEDARLLGYCMDFGFSSDPTTLVAVYKMDEELYFDELLYLAGLTNPEICARLKAFGVGNNKIICDSAEPKSIMEIKAYGFNAVAAQKGPDSIRMGIDILKRFQMNVTKRSTNMIKELRAYRWEVDKDGKETGDPVDHSNHSLDAIRYFALNMLGVKRKTSYKSSY